MSVYGENLMSVHTRRCWGLLAMPVGLTLDQELPGGRLQPVGGGRARYRTAAADHEAGQAA